MNALQPTRRSFMVIFRNVTLAFTMPLVAMNLAIGRFALAGFVLLAPVGAQIGAALARRDHMALSAIVSTTFLATSIYGAVILGDGTAGSATTYLALLPIFATIAGGTRVGALTLTAVLASLLALMANDPGVAVPTVDDIDTLRLVASRGVLVGLVGTLSLLLVRGADRLNSELHRARQQAESADGAKGRLLANCSHDLRTPLHAVQGYTALLAEDAEVEHRPHEVEDLARINAASQELLRVIEQVIALARLQDAPPGGARSFANLPSLLAEVAPHGVSTSIDLQVTAPLVDVELLRELLHNLAVALARHPGPRLHISAPEPETLRILGFARFQHLLDSGQDPFEPFQDGGLELTLCARQAAALGGSASVRERGVSCLCVDLPVR